MYKYTYMGPVMYYDKVAANYWKGETFAESQEKAVSNLKYQFKNQTKMMPNAGGIKFTGCVSCKTI